MQTPTWETTRQYSWVIRKDDSMLIDIFHNDQRVMSINVGEAMEAIGRKRIMQHVRTCDNTPWLSRWVTDEERAVHKTFNTIKNS